MRPGRCSTISEYQCYASEEVRLKLPDYEYTFVEVTASDADEAAKKFVKIKRDENNKFLNVLWEEFQKYLLNPGNYFTNDPITEVPYSVKNNKRDIADLIGVRESGRQGRESIDLVYSASPTSDGISVVRLPFRLFGEESEYLHSIAYLYTTNFFSYAKDIIYNFIFGRIKKLMHVAEDEFIIDVSFTSDAKQDRNYTVTTEGFLKFKKNANIIRSAENNILYKNDLTEILLLPSDKKPTGRNSYDLDYLPTKVYNDFVVKVVMSRDELIKIFNISVDTINSCTRHERKYEFGIPNWSDEFRLIGIYLEVSSSWSVGSTITVYFERLDGSEQIIQRVTNQPQEFISYIELMHSIFTNKDFVKISSDPFTNTVLYIHKEFIEREMKTTSDGSILFFPHERWNRREIEISKDSAKFLEKLLVKNIGRDNTNSAMLLSSLNLD